MALRHRGKPAVDESVPPQPLQLQPSRCAWWCGSGAAAGAGSPTYSPSAAASSVTHPRGLPESSSTAVTASHSRGTGTQYGGYLKRATSRMSTESEARWYPPMGEKWPEPVCK